MNGDMFLGANAKPSGAKITILPNGSNVGFVYIGRDIKVPFADLLKVALEVLTSTPLREIGDGRKDFIREVSNLEVVTEEGVEYIR